MKLQQLFVLALCCYCQAVESSSQPNLRQRQQQQSNNNNDDDEHNNHRKLIIGGTNAEENEFPFIVSWHKRDLESHPNCAGSLVAPNMVLTVASCANSLDSPLRIGSLYPTKNGITATIEEIIIHPDYDGIYYDFCLLRLSESISTRDYIELNFIRELPSTGDALEVVGFGTTMEKSWTPAQQLQKVQLVDVSYDECRQQYSKKDILNERFGSNKPSLFQIRDKFHICTGPAKNRSPRSSETNDDGTDSEVLLPENADACYGDSGGPIIMYSTLDGRPKLVGLVSTRNGCAKPNQSGVYPRISIAQPWLVYEICSRSMQPSYCRGFTKSPTTSVMPSHAPSKTPSNAPSGMPSSPFPSSAPSAPTSMPSLLTEEPSVHPSMNPTRTDRPTVTCIQCNDANAPPHFLGDGLTCATVDLDTEYTNKCKDNTYWTRQKYCQLQCYQAGLGYDGDVCCSTTTTTDDMTTKPPTASPTIVNGDGSLQHEDCTVCNDIPNNYMLTVGSDCSTSSLIRTKCSLNQQWNKAENQWCRLSCYKQGRGYHGDKCCVLGPRTPAPTPSPPSSTPSISPTRDGDTYTPTVFVVPEGFWSFMDRVDPSVFLD